MDHATYEWESVAVCCRVLQWVAARSSMLHVTYGKVQGEILRVHKSHDAALHRVEVCWSVLTCVEVCCSMVQGVAVRCSVLLWEMLHLHESRCLCCSALQCVAKCCSVLQRVAACCSVLQRVAVFWRLLHSVALRNIAYTRIKIWGSFHAIMPFPDLNQALCRFIHELQV